MAAGKNNLTPDIHIYDYRERSKARDSDRPGTGPRAGRSGRQDGGQDGGQVNTDVRNSRSGLNLARNDRTGIIVLPSLVPVLEIKLAGSQVLEIKFSNSLLRMCF
jgi:hypothetical protein